MFGFKRKSFYQDSHNSSPFISPAVTDGLRADAGLEPGCWDIQEASLIFWSPTSAMLAQEQWLVWPLEACQVHMDWSMTSMLLEHETIQDFDKAISGYKWWVH